MSIHKTSTQISPLNVCRSKLSLAQLLLTFSVAYFVSSPMLTSAADNSQCENVSQRGLVLSGGGAKGAFEAGAVHHLIVDRGCDFQDFSGVSVGALNASFLAEASSNNSSLANLKTRANALVEYWKSIKSADDVLHAKFLGLFRLVIFGLEGLNDFSPLRSMIEREIHPDLLRTSGRDLRVGVVSFYDGTYREILPSSPFLLYPEQFREYVYASALIPVHGVMPRIKQAGDDNNSENWHQFSDGGVRHATPVAGYFQPCDFKPLIAELKIEKKEPCTKYSYVPAHRQLKELMIVVANPYKPDGDDLPPPQCCPIDKQKRHVSDGKEILFRTLDIALNSPYRWDINFARSANHMLEWRRDLYVAMEESLDHTAFEIFGRELQKGAETFPVRSSNAGPNGLDLPYSMGITIPDESYADTYAFDPINIRLQLRKGCEAANAMMVKDFKKDSMVHVCEMNFPLK